MAIKQSLVLVIDDDETNRFLLQSYLENSGYQAAIKKNGKVAWKYLQNGAPEISAILLDKMMPEMDGLEFLKLIKSHDEFEDIPVIMQTGVSDNNSIREGISAGAYYYLTKPFKEQTVLSIVNAAVKDFEKYKTLCEEAEKNKLTASSLQNSRFELKTIEEANAISALLASAYPDPDNVVSGISELILNAIEHGNLEINYTEKTTLCSSDNLNDEITKRLNDETYKDRKITIDFIRSEKKLSLTISDEGKGFDWRPYIELTPDRVYDSHGRGIALAALSFDSIEYNKKGNSVTCTVKTN